MPTGEVVRYEDAAVQVQQKAPDCLPAYSVDVLLQRRDDMVRFVQKLMQKDQDYGTIPGSAKDTLLKPGAEKLCNFFGLSPEFSIIEKVEEWGDGGREPLFAYTYRCSLLKNGVVVGTGDGHCNSRESKYRYRQSERVCPECGKPTIIKGKPEYEKEARFKGGFLCYPKKGGCGQKFEPKDPAIIGQDTGRIVNPDVADLVNTILKMAQKRALIAAVLVTTSASEFFTQDLEDAGSAAVVEEAAGVAVISPDHRRALWAAARGKGWTEEQVRVLLHDSGYEHTADITMADYPALLKLVSAPPPRQQQPEPDPWAEPVAAYRKAVAAYNEANPGHVIDGEAQLLKLRAKGDLAELRQAAAELAV